MKRFLVLATVSFVLLVTFGMRVQAQPKDVTEAVTQALFATVKTLSLEEGRVRREYDAIGIVLSDTGSGLFHEATLHVLGGSTNEKGTYKDEQSWGVYNLQNGDKVFFTGTGAGEMTSKVGGEAKLTGAITGGTGKCAGIKGSLTFTRHSLRPVLEGTVQLYHKGTIKYTLP